MTRGGFPLTKLVKLAACGSSDSTSTKRVSRGLGLDGEDGQPPASPNGGENTLKKSTAADVTRNADILRIRAPVTPDLLRQVIGVVQTSASSVCDAEKSGESNASTSSGHGETTAEEWLRYYPAPASALLESSVTSNGLRGTGSGSLAVPRTRPSGSEECRNIWTLMEAAERAKENAFKCCGVIEASTGVGLHDPSASSVSGGTSAMTSGMDWNPQFAPRLHEAEAALVEWLMELTMALHGLTFPFSVAFITEPTDGYRERGHDLAETTALAEDLWTSYEESVKRQLELTLEARREQLREQSQPMGIALCFAAQNRACAAELLERKRAEMTALHEATVGVLRAPEKQSLLRRAEAAREKWSGLLIAEGFHALDDLVERVQRTRLQVTLRFRADFRLDPRSGKFYQASGML